MQKDVLEFFKKYRGEVFTYGDEKMSKFLVHLKYSAITFTIWKLSEESFLGK